MADCFSQSSWRLFRLHTFCLPVYLSPRLCLLPVFCPALRFSVGVSLSAVESKLVGWKSSSLGGLTDRIAETESGKEEGRSGLADGWAGLALSRALRCAALRCAVLPAGHCCPFQPSLPRGRAAVASPSAAAYQNCILPAVDRPWTVGERASALVGEEGVAASGVGRAAAAASVLAVSELVQLISSLDWHQSAHLWFRFISSRWYPST